MLQICIFCNLLSSELSVFLCFFTSEVSYSKFTFNCCQKKSKKYWKLFCDIARYLS